MKKLIFTTLFSVFSILNLSAQKTDASISKLYQNYLSIKTALAADNGDDASKAANIFVKSASMVDYKVLSEGNLDALRKDASQIAESRSIEKQRESFNGLSDNMIPLAQKFKLADDSVFVQFCPMADASWLSAEKEIRNPYYGASMLKCGSVKKVLK
ncbi:DUF3347 domain-containing protein [Kaistella antarctica]|uniref:Protein of uncharacterized function (DUF3347) n=1 Tax=Kaistella antarctica TaxID=266748 RepID=A0A3S4YUM9_9FLAO|nr:DUF3347 domain-containing protein [Kaistella antarctica]KEY18361.1 hypothetical protein HY04_07540 [Kaistella antarctica]SEV85009.1 Protein of unknown function [Kaistella antarctica]VEI01052.1 Protein of uncharacterised function (DUF3347) [Kaistella antarctica]